MSMVLSSKVGVRSASPVRRQAAETYPGWVKCTLMIGLPGMFWALLFTGIGMTFHHH
jgi:hypothetical protein